MTPDERKLTLRKPDACGRCAVALPVGSLAWYRKADKSVACQSCAGKPETITVKREVIHIDTVQLMVSGVGLLIFVLYVPGGLAQLLDRLREMVVRRVQVPETVTEPKPMVEAPPTSSRGAPHL